MKELAQYFNWYDKLKYETPLFPHSSYRRGIDLFVQ